MAAVVGWITAKLLATIGKLTSSQSVASSSSAATNPIQALERLKRMLLRIQAVLRDAEEREIRDEYVKLWLKEIKEVAYDAEDVLDEYQYDLLRSQIEGRAALESAETSSSSSSSYSRKRKLEEMKEQVYSSTSTSCSLLSPIIAGDLVDRINKINEKFDEIAKDRDALCLREVDGPWRKDDCIVPQPTGSHVDESDIYGREEDRDKIVELLLSGDEKFSVLPIVGMGGLGKTTLAQLVYNDERIDQFFNLKGWVCVSDDFNVVRLIRAVIESFSKVTCNLTELSALQDIIKEKLKGKRVFLVLDDIWNERQSLWDLLRAPLVGAEMIKIIITTRNESVADIMQTITPYYLGFLTEEKSWLLFQKHACADRDPIEQPILLEIGKKIVEKCGRLPLALKVIGGLLRYRKANEESWKDILQSNIWELDGTKDEILPALRLSYYYLPPHLKPCFIYCSLFPKDEKFNKSLIIDLWMAQGYIIQSGEMKSTKDIGNEYIEELKRRSLLQSPKESFWSLLMHDLIHDLASSISEKEYLQIIVESDADTYNIPDEVRHLHITNRLENIPRQLFSSLPKALRTFVVNDYNFNAVLNKQFPLENLGRLRALELCFNGLEGWPESIGTLKHLRYFGINPLMMYKVSPPSVGQIWMPCGIGKLTNLMKIPEVVVGGAFLGDIEELKDLVSLRELWITRLRDVAHVEDARKADLQSKQRMEKLILNWHYMGEVSDSGRPAPTLES